MTPPDTATQSQTAHAGPDDVASSGHNAPEAETTPALSPTPHKDKDTTRMVKLDAINVLIHALTANSTHGLRRTNADKRRAGEMALQEFRVQSHNFIAAMSGVTQMLVEDLQDLVKAALPPERPAPFYWVFDRASDKVARKVTGAELQNIYDHCHGVLVLPHNKRGDWKHASAFGFNLTPAPLPREDSTVLGFINAPKQ